MRKYVPGHPITRASCRRVCVFTPNKVGRLAAYALSRYSTCSKETEQLIIQSINHSKMILNLLCLLLLVPSDTTSVDPKKEETKYVVWYSPSSATKVYGTMINFSFRDLSKDDVILPTIYGTELSINPAFVILSAFMLPYAIIFPSSHFDSLDHFKIDSFKKVYGLKFSFIDPEETESYGLDINLFGLSYKHTGLNFSIIQNKHAVINGLSLSILGNHNVKANGVQIGLFNSSKDFRGLQLGLWNR